jgi:hypothetical protein
MNERIQELALQAGVTGYFAAGTKLATPIPLSPEMQKFAELIVQECANLTLDYKTHDHYMGWVDHGEAIAQHFGVNQ